MKTFKKQLQLTKASLQDRYRSAPPAWISADATVPATVTVTVTVYKGKNSASLVVQSKMVAVTKHLVVAAKLNSASAKAL